MVAMIETEINGRWTLLLPEHRAERPEWSTPAGWERERLDHMHDVITREVERLGSARPVMVDVGTEEGDLSALYAKWGCDLVLIEPNPRVWPNVRAIWEANSLRPPLTTWVGFAAEYCNDLDAPNTATWFAQHQATAVPHAGAWPGCAYGPIIGDHSFMHLAQHSHVPAMTIDRLTMTPNPRWWFAQPTPVHGITIDVEGSELRVLRGAAGVLSTHRPHVWVSVHTDEQWMGDWYPTDGRAAVDEYMAGFGYSAHHLATDHEEHVYYEPSQP